MVSCEAIRLLSSQVRTISYGLYQTPVQYSIHHQCNLNNTPSGVHHVVSHQHRLRVESSKINRIPKEKADHAGESCDLFERLTDGFQLEHAQLDQVGSCYCR